MQQLRVFPDSTQVPSTGVMIDLYEQDPIKLTLSVEDITNAEASSAFSKTFRVPATPTNNGFFKHAFLIDGIDYDVTVKKPAQVLIDGAEFKTGHIRLQKIYINGLSDTIEYEILFLGETRDFSTKLGDKSLSNLSMPEISHLLSAANVVQSWQAFPEGADGDGLFNGDVLYPLIDHGNTYEDSIPQESRISMEGSHRFTQNNFPITAERFKPMLRAKMLWDKIFEDAGYTYQSQFLNGNTFQRLYVSAFGNEADVDLNVGENSINNMEFTDILLDTRTEPLNFKLPILDPGGNLDLLNSAYIAPITGTYRFEASLFASVWQVLELGGGRLQRVYVDARIDIVKNGTTVIASGGSQLTPSTLTIGKEANAVTLNAGDSVQLYLSSTQPYDQVETSNRIWKCTSSPGEFNPISTLDNEYKQVDFVKDILTLFRLVMSPDPYTPNRFLIEPYINYVYTGVTRDWSEKLVRDKDFEIEPLFDTQTDRIEFRFQNDGDYINKYHLDAYQNPYGYLAFDSGNDLLKGTRKIGVGFAPTPMTRIEGAPNTSSWIIPQLHTHSAGDGGTEHLPIKSKTRLLFYNGLKASDQPWHLAGVTGHIEEYPQVSPYESFPQTSTSLNLNWYNDIKYWGSNVAGYQTDGITLFQRYWNSYITDLYNSQARRVTAYFTLNNVDLQGFAFNDIIFVDGVYYRPEKILDAPIGAMSKVKVQLIKAIDYRPVDFQQPILFSLDIMGVSCNGDMDGSVTINITNGIEPYEYELSTGETGFFASREKTFSDFAPGNYSVTITESAGFSRTAQFIITEPTLLSAIESISNEYPAGANNGSITVAPQGGTQPYTILWTDSNTSFERTNLGAGFYTYTITDARGCQYGNTVEVQEGLQDLQVIVNTENPSNCGVTDGVIELLIAGGTPPYTVNWSDIGVGPATRSNLIEGTYTYTITDSASAQLGPDSVILECFNPAYPIDLAEGYGSETDSCLNFDQGFISQYWIDTPTIGPGTKMYYSQQGARDLDVNDLVATDYYSDGTTSYYFVDGIYDSESICNVDTATQFNFTARYFDNQQELACSDTNWSNTVWSLSDTLEIGTELFQTEQGALTNDFNDLLLDGWYGTLIEGPLGVVRWKVSGGIIIEFIDC